MMPPQEHAPSTRCLVPLGILDIAAAGLAALMRPGVMRGVASVVRLEYGVARPRGRVGC